jgi:hypothetical protein
MVGHHHVFLVDMSHVGRYVRHVELRRPWYLKNWGNQKKVYQEEQYSEIYPKMQ